MAQATGQPQGFTAYGVDPNGNYQALSVTTSGVLQAGGGSASANVLAGYQAATATTAATTVITVPQGRTWVGTVAVSVNVTNAAAATTAASALGVISTAGTGVVPAAGSYFEVSAATGANAAGGTVGDGGQQFGSIPMTVIAPAGNSVTVQVTATISGTSGRVAASAIGMLL